MVNADAVEILFVEDNPHDVELTLRALKKHNLASRALVMRDGAEALEFLFATGRYASRGLQNGPKVILLDLKLPKVSGLEVLRRIKSDDRMKLTPVVVLTSSAEQRDVVESYRLGVNSYVVKPVDYHKFVECVSELGLYWVVYNLPSPLRAPGPGTGG